MRMENLSNFMVIYFYASDTPRNASMEDMKPCAYWGEPAVVGSTLDCVCGPGDQYLTHQLEDLDLVEQSCITLLH